MAKQSIANIKAPRNFQDSPREIQLYCIEIEVYTVYRQIMELNVTDEQALDLVTISLMKYNKHNAFAFKEVLKEIVRKYSFYDVYSRALIRYFWTSGMGINKIQKLCRQSQHTVYNVCEKYLPAITEGKIKTKLEHFASSQFIAELDTLLFMFSTFEGNQCRRDDESGMSKLDALRMELNTRKRGDLL